MERSDPDMGGGAQPLADGKDRQVDGTEKLLTPGEVAQLFGVDPKTVSRWSDAGKIDALRTLGGHRRYRASEVQSLLDDALGA